MADDQTPSENPFETAMIDGELPSNEPAEENLSKGTPGVAAKAGKSFLVLGIVVLVVLFLLYQILGGKKKQPTINQQEITIAPKPAQPPPLPIVEPIPALPLPGPITPLPSIPEPIDVPAITKLNPKEDSAAKAQALARIRSSMMLKDDGNSLLAETTSGSSPPPPNDPNSLFAASLANTKTERVEATRIGSLNRTIAQGRIIQATMESALNTDLPAPIRAIVSRDTYAEAGNVPLIPKGSRLIGRYNTVLSSGQTRVFVVWTRVIRPDGVDIALGSPLVDAIGQAGVTGQIDSKFQQIFARSLLSSVMNIATAIGAEKIQGGTTTTTTSSTTGSQTSGDAATTATTNALNRLGAVTDGFLQRFINVPATILIDQGTKVNVFVNKDLVFPSDSSGTRIIN